MLHSLSTTTKGSVPLTSPSSSSKTSMHDLLHALRKETKKLQKEKTRSDPSLPHSKAPLKNNTKAWKWPDGRATQSKFEAKSARRTSLYQSSTVEKSAKTEKSETYGRSNNTHWEVTVYPRKPLVSSLCYAFSKASYTSLSLRKTQEGCPSEPNSGFALRNETIPKVVVTAYVVVFGFLHNNFSASALIIFALPPSLAHPLDLEHPRSSAHDQKVKPAKRSQARSSP